VTERVEPVIVYHGRNEFEAQMARDVLASAMIPVLHVPSLSAGIFGVARPTRVAVPKEYAEAAVEALRDAGIGGSVQNRPKGLEEFQDAFGEGFPRQPSLEGAQGPLRRSIPWLAALFLVVAIAAWSRGC